MAIAGDSAQFKTNSPNIRTNNGYRCRSYVRLTAWGGIFTILDSSCERSPHQWSAPVNWIDLILLVVLFLFGLRGYFKGLFRETFSLGGLVIGFMVAVRYDEAVAAWAGFYWNVSSIFLKGVAFVVIFFVVYFIFAVAGWLLHRAAKVLFLQ